MKKFSVISCTFLARRLRFLRLRLSTFNSRLSTRGFTVLFAALIASLLLAVGLAIFDIIFKEVSFATVVRDSNYAIYAADTGAECALFWDSQCAATGLCPSSITAFATSSLSRPPSSGAVCDGQDIITGAVGPRNPYGPWAVDPSLSAATTTFTMNLAPGGQPPYCTIVEVIKTVEPLSGVVGTVIVSRGYNTCDSSNPNRIERAYNVSY